MKKYLLTLLAAGSLGAAQAQTGSILVQGDLSYTGAKDAAETKTSEFAINPTVGYQLNKCLTVGLVGGFQSNSIKPKGVDATKANAFRIGVFARCTHNVGRIFFLYGQLEAGYNNVGETKSAGVVLSPKETGFYAGLTPNVGVNVCHGFALNFGFGGLSYSSMKADVTGAKAATSFNLNFGQQFHVGVSKNFGGKKYRGHHGMMDETRKIDASDDDGDEDAAPKKKKKSKNEGEL